MKIIIQEDRYLFSDVPGLLMEGFTQLGAIYNGSHWVFMYDNPNIDRLKKFIVFAGLPWNPIVPELEIKEDFNKFIEENKDVFHTKPFNFQYEGIYLLNKNPYFGLFAEQGLGKTKMILDDFAIKYKNNPNTRLLIVTKNYLVRNWKGEVKKHQPKFKLSCLLGSAKHKTKVLKDVRNLFDKVHIIATNIEGMIERYSNKDDAIKANPFLNALKETLDDKYEIIGTVDESTIIKTPRAKQCKVMFRLRDYFKYRRILTGTPLTRDLRDLWSQFTFLEAQATGYNSYNAFEQNHITYNPLCRHQVDSIRNKDKFVNRVSKYCAVYKKADHLNLPPKLYSKVYVPVTREQIKHITDLTAMNYTEIDNEEIYREHILSKRHAFLQLANGFVYINEFDPITGKRISRFSKHIPCYKHQYLIENIKDNPENTHVIKHIYHEETDRLIKELNKAKISFKKLLPEIDDSEAHKVIEQFNQGKVKVLLMRGFETGVTLLSRNTVVHYVSNSDKYEDRAQHEDRFHRIGTETSVLYIDYVTAGTKEEGIIDNLTRKKGEADWFSKQVQKERKEGKAWSFLL